VFALGPPSVPRIITIPLCSWITPGGGAGMVVFDKCNLVLDPELRQERVRLIRVMQQNAKAHGKTDRFVFRTCVVRLPRSSKKAKMLIEES
jgi:hypothetical protein